MLRTAVRCLATTVLVRYGGPMPLPASKTTPLHTLSGIRRYSRWVFGVALALGIALFVACGALTSSKAQWIQYGAAVVTFLLALVPVFNSRLSRLLDRIRRPSANGRRLFTILLWAGASWYFLDTAVRQNRVLIPKYHDEQMYATQAQLVAHGRLWLPQHPLAEFFETFHVMVRPVYAPIYFPGTAMLFAPAVWLGVPLAFWAALIAGAIVGLSYRVFTELYDGAAGALAAGMAIALPSLHFVSVMMMSHSAALLLSLVMCWAWLRWRRFQQWQWVLVLGVATGWAAITRPFDALCFALPIAVAMSVDINRHYSGQHAFRRWFLTLALVTAGACPLLAIQGVLDVGTTGHVLQTPAAAYAQMYWPTAGMGFRTAAPGFHPPTPLKQFDEYYVQRLLPEMNAHARAGFVRTLLTRVAYAAFSGGSASVILLVLLPTGLLGLSRLRWVMVVPMPIFAVAYACYPFVLYHYALAVAPAIAALVLSAIAVTRVASPALATSLAISVFAASLASLHEVNPAMHDADFPAPFLQDVARQLGDIHERAVVLFRYVGGGDFDEEPVYNFDVAWPDDALIIRAHDLGPKNSKLFAYYARIDPERVIYTYDRKTLHLERLGTARQMAAQFPATNP